MRMRVHEKGKEREGADRGEEGVERRGEAGAGVKGGEERRKRTEKEKEKEK